MQKKRSTPKVLLTSNSEDETKLCGARLAKQLKAGDRIFVTGPLGGSFKSGRHLNFLPRLAQARFLVENFKPNAMIDISDGLSGDLNHILKESQVGARLDTAFIPRYKGVSSSQALNDGEDFELLFTLSPKSACSLMDWQAQQKSF